MDLQNLLLLGMIATILGGFIYATYLATKAITAKDQWKETSYQIHDRYIDEKKKNEELLSENKSLKNHLNNYRTYICEKEGITDNELI